MYMHVNIILPGLINPLSMYIAFMLGVKRQDDALRGSKEGEGGSRIDTS